MSPTTLLHSLILSKSIPEQARRGPPLRRVQPHLSLGSVQSELARRQWPRLSLMPASQTGIYSDMLYDTEIFWVTRQPEFAHLGYEFRPRFRPGWRRRKRRPFLDFFKPDHAFRGEDSVPLPVSALSSAGGYYVLSE